MKKILLFVLLLSCLAFLAGVAVVVKPFGDFAAGSSKNASTVQQSAPPEVEVQREVVLYFGTLGVPQLAQETRYIPECDTERECIMELVQQLIAGPVVAKDAAGVELAPVLPAETLLLDAEVVDETVKLNFNKALISYHPGGSSSELLTVHAIINTVAANMPHIRQMQLLVDGHPLETLRGHVDLRQPVVADFSLVRQESEVSAVEAVPNPLGAVDMETLEPLQNNPQSGQTGEYTE